MRCFSSRISILGVLCAAVLTLPGPAAQADEAAHVSIELNALEPGENACRFSFVIRNGHGADIEQAVYEAVLFDADGRVERLTLFDFGALPSARPRVRQFVVPDLRCEVLGRVLFNGVETCAVTGLADDACTSGLRVSSRTEIEVLG